MTHKPWSVFIGFDPRPEEHQGFTIARESIRKFHRHLVIRGLVLNELNQLGLYWRPTERRNGKLWDVISNAPMATEFALSRFLVPAYARKRSKPPYGWAIYLDCDVLVRGSLNPLIEQLDDAMPLYCVKHEHKPVTDIKMDGQRQTSYPRKNWSSVMAINCDHGANEWLTPKHVNAAKGLDLHQFKWLHDNDIGELSPIWNYLVGHTVIDQEPKIVHFTDGLPNIPAYANVEYADEWHAELARWAA